MSASRNIWGHKPIMATTAATSSKAIMFVSLGRSSLRSLAAAAAAMGAEAQGEQGQGGGTALAWILLRLVVVHAWTPV